jgi:tetratricopeptide (TPR) repeat protein
MAPIKTLNSKKNKNKTLGLDKISFYLMFLLGFLVPIFFLPFLNISMDVSKGVLISTFTTVAFFLWLIARLKDGRFIFPKSIVLAAGALVPLAFFFSAAFSEVPKASFVGLGYELGTFTSILVFFILMFLSSIFFQKGNRTPQLYSVILFSAGIVFLYQVVQIIFISFGLPFAEIFLKLPGNLIGKWADMSIFFGLTTILSLITLELVPLKRKAKVLLYSTLAASVLVLIVVNMKLSWIIVGFFSLVIFVYTISFGKGRISEDGERKIPTTPFAILLLSLFFVLAGSVVGDFIYSTLNIPQEILRPSWGQTLEVAKDSLVENPIFGAGPNRFGSSWLLFKPDNVNISRLWSVDFDTGVGLIPSMMITTGGLGILAWLIFLIMFFYRGVRSIFAAHSSTEHHYIMLSSFLTALYLWVFSFFYVPNVTIVFLAFLMTGVFIASLVKAGVVKNYNFSFLEDPRIGFVSVLVLILLIISSIAGSYLLFQKFLSVGYFQRSTTALNFEGNINKAEKNIIRAIKLNKSDLYYRALVDINLAQLRSVLSKKDVSKETIRSKFTSISRTVIQNAVTATEIDSSNYLNWLTLANVYGSLMQLGAPEGFYKSAKQSYEKARALNPNSPSIILKQAQLEIVAGNKDAAKEYIAQALNKKNNYTQAIFLLSQIQVDEGNLDDAIKSVEVVSLVSPNDIGVFFQLGLLRYKNKEYGGAISAFERAVELNPNYSNAKYFLGLAYSKEGQRSKAIEQFEQILTLNPGNKEVGKILKNLKNGRRPLSNAEDVKSLPIKEE